jgi:hypothetical protein
MAAGGENRWPYLGRNRWPLTALDSDDRPGDPQIPRAGLHGSRDPVSPCAVSRAGWGRRPALLLRLRGAAMTAAGRTAADRSKQPRRPRGGGCSVAASRHAGHDSSLMLAP